MKSPLISVICLCFNHEKFVVEAIESVRRQSYPNIQLVVVDDHSTDQSVATIQDHLGTGSEVEFMALGENLGNCRAFNRGFKIARGEFVIDLAADDVLLPERVEMGLQAFHTRDEKVGINFTDAFLIDENGLPLGLHSDRFPHETIPEGDVYADVLSRYFINGPTMMMRRAVLEQLGGYDESLAYEDFDFWVRSSREFRYCYTPVPLVKRRIVPSSLGHRQHRLGSAQLRSTLAVCGKALRLNRTAVEHRALKRRIQFEMRQAVLMGDFGLARDYWKLWRKVP